jgi:hypothetical protein
VTANLDLVPRTDSWTPINLNQLPEKPPIQPELGGTRLVYPGKRHVFSGPPESAKTLAAYCVLIRVVRTGGTGVLIDFEMGAYDARQRIRELGATDEEISQILYLEPDERATAERITSLITYEPQIVVIDAAAGAYELEGLDDNKRLEVERFANLYVKPFWRNEIATILIDHVVKDAEHRGRYQIGSERKLGVLDVHYGFDIVKPISRGTSGHYKILTHKDRAGYMKRGHLADLHLDSDPDTHLISWKVTDPDLTTDKEGNKRRTWYMEQVSVELESRDDHPSRNQVATAIKRRKEYVLDAIGTLITEGFVVEEKPDGATSLGLSLRRPYRADDPGCNPQNTASGSAVPVWFHSGSGNQSAVGGSAVPPPYGGNRTETTAAGPPEQLGWFHENGHLTDTDLAYLEDIAPEPDDDLFTT